MYIIVRDDGYDGGYKILGLDTDLESLKQKALLYIEENTTRFGPCCVIIYKFSLGGSFIDGEIIWSNYSV